MNTSHDMIRRNYTAVLERIAAACHRCGRDPESVKLIAVVKYAELEWVRALVELGVTELGEARPQQLDERIAEFADTIHWHLIGHLQRNKIRRVLPHAHLIHSIDSLKLLQAVDRIAGELSLHTAVLLQVNVSGEESKTGFSPEELRNSWEDVLDCEHLTVRGLMTMAPRTSDPTDTRAAFAGLRSLREALLDSCSDRTALPELSMGMSGDYEIAIEEGATLVRIGSSLFKGIDPSP